MNTFRKASNPVVTMVVKDFGIMKIELFPEVVPNTAHNFIDLVLSKYYDGLIFHRVIPSFMIQGGQGKQLNPIKGDFLSNGVKNPIIHEKGVISMARTNNPNSATSQFFIMHHPAPHLDGQYAAFGIVIEGLEVIDKIAHVKRDPYDRPIIDVIIESVNIDLKGQSYPKPIHI